MGGFGPDDWIENFRMSKNTFNYLCDRLKGSIFRQNTRFRKAITVHQRVAITLWCLATSCEYRTLSHLFGVARSTVCEIVQDTCRAIVSVLMDTYISFPLGDALVNVVNGFERDGVILSVLEPLMGHIFLSLLLQKAILTITIEKGGTQLLFKLLLITNTSFEIFVLGGLVVFMMHGC